MHKADGHVSVYANNDRIVLGVNYLSRLTAKGDLDIQHNIPTKLDLGKTFEQSTHSCTPTEQPLTLVGQ
jgi:hypothetical protein